ncbi:MAG TPA: glycogen synthase GlgA [Magnetospirillaceae bacterium]|jgi:starch synthase
MTSAAKADLKVLSVASEVYPLIKTGGLADVAGALPAALATERVAVRTLVPGYPQVIAALEQSRVVHAWPNLFGGPAQILMGKAKGLDVFILSAKHLFDRPGNPYTNPAGTDWPDNAQRFAALARAGADIGMGSVADFKPDVVHAHDWQAGLTAAYLRYAKGKAPGTVFTVHNLAYQGQFPATLLAALGLPPTAYAIDGVEYFGTIGYLKAAIQLSDRITTVSPSYAAEMMGPEAGMGLDGLLRVRAKDVFGILNGIDTGVWNPADDRFLAAPYDISTIKERAKNKAALQERMDLKVDPDALLFGVVSRLSWQKGLDLLVEALPELLGANGQLALIGTGDIPLQNAYTYAAEQNPGRIGCVLGYDEELAHLIQAGADVILVPSRYEPCGLTQLCALRYGAVPLVARVGGLADTIIDANEMAIADDVATGIQFAPVDANMLRAAIRRTARLFADKPSWARVQSRGMKADVSWRNPAKRYASLYRQLVAARGKAR